MYMLFSLTFFVIVLGFLLLGQMVMGLAVTHRPFVNNIAVLRVCTLIFT